MTPLRLRGWASAACAAAATVALALPCAAQSLPSEPLVFGGGRVTVSGDVSATISCGDGGATTTGCGQDLGYFNYTDYQRSVLRMLRLDLSAVVRASRRLSVLADLRSENGTGPQPYGLYLRVRPWLGRNLDVQIGRVPPTFGAFARRTYPADNLLIGYPLAYQYLTSLRPDAVPASADELLRMRGRGWLSTYSLGNRSSDNGLPIATGFRWDTGIQLHAASPRLEAAAAITTGSLGNPLLADDNGGKQLAGRVTAKPLAGLVVGASAARGPYLANAAVRAAPAGARHGPFTQTAVGLDAEFSRDYYLLRIETIVSRWRLPLTGTPAVEGALGAVATSIEGRYKLRPALYLAARFDHLGFSTVQGTDTIAPWDAPVSRGELVAGYALQRNLQLKIGFQHNRREAGRVTRMNVGAAQILFWF